MKLSVFLMMFALLICSCEVNGSDGPPKVDSEEIPGPLKIGYALSINRFTPENLNYSKSVGIDHVEASSMNSFFDSEGNFIKSEEEVTEIMTKAKEAADEAGINIWSVHMAYSQYMDLSTIVEEDRQRVVTMHKKLLGFLEILEPEVILFHPSYYLDPPGQRDMRKNQMIKSAKELDKAVQAIGATMVIENMLGPELMKGDRERPLMRTVEETVEIFNRLPGSIHSAIDMNHIKNPENLIRAMDDRLETVHIADGTGTAENHYFPCSGEGENDWVEILSALNEVGYTNPFMFESDFEDEKDLVECYESLYDRFLNEEYQVPLESE